MTLRDSAIQEIKQIIKIFSPILIRPQKTSINIGISKDFLLLQIIKRVIRKMEADPYLNFINELKYYKVLGKIIHGPIEEIYRDRNKRYIRHFFESKELYDLVKKDLEWVYNKNKKVLITMNKKGYVIYHNYKKNKFNILLLTIHSGTFMPSDIAGKQAITKKERMLEEDIDIHKIYSPLVLENAGIWIDNKLSRFACDYNRSPEKAIYNNKSELWIQKLWKKPLNKQQRKRLMDGYEDFYLTLRSLVDSYRFNIIFDGHSMKHVKDRADVSFGTKYIPRFYMPVVRTMKEQLLKLGYSNVAFDKPFSGGYILQWLSRKFPNIFICSMEVNKNLYMNKGRTASHEPRINTLSSDILQIFNIE